MGCLSKAKKIYIDLYKIFASSGFSKSTTQKKCTLLMVMVNSLSNQKPCKEKIFYGWFKWTKGWLVEINSK